jgi:hypothetical protein
MILRQKSEIRPSAYRDTVDTPFRSTGPAHRRAVGQ